MKNLRLFVVFLFMLMGMQSVMAQMTPEMLETLKKEAGQGKIESQSILASCYMLGNGVEKDMSKALYWYGKAAAQGDLEASQAFFLIKLMESKDDKIKKEYESLNEVDRKILSYLFSQDITLPISEAITMTKDLTDEGKATILGKDEIDKMKLNEKSNIVYGKDHGNNRCLADGTILYKRNGVLKVIDGKMVFTMNDGTVFTGFFKEQTTFNGSDKDWELLEINEPKLVNFLELTPWKGTFKYADGRTDEIAGTWKKSEADKKHKEAVNAKIKQIETAHAKYTKKYGATYSNALSKDGKITKEMPLAFIKEYITDFNSMGIYLLGETQHITLNEYEPSMRDMTQYGRSVQVFRLFCGDALIWIFKVLNGKVIMTSLPQPGLEAVISMDRDWEQLSTEKLLTP